MAMSTDGRSLNSFCGTFASSGKAIGSRTAATLSVGNSSTSRKTSCRAALADAEFVEQDGRQQIDVHHEKPAPLPHRAERLFDPVARHESAPCPRRGLTDYTLADGVAYICAYATPAPVIAES